jgi:hypothetical protein
LRHQHRGIFPNTHCKNKGRCRKIGRWFAKTKGPAKIGGSLLGQIYSVPFGGYWDGGSTEVERMSSGSKSLPTIGERHIDVSVDALYLHNLYLFRHKPSIHNVSADEKNVV